VEGRCSGLLDEPKPGAPRVISEAQIEDRSTLTLETTPVDATHWSTRSLAKACGLSQSAVARIWKAFALQPHRTETFKLSRDWPADPRVEAVVAGQVHESGREDDPARPMRQHRSLLVVDQDLRRHAAQPLERPNQRLVGVLGVLAGGAPPVKPTRAGQEIEREVDGGLHARNRAHDRAPVALDLAARKRREAHRRATQQLRPLRPDVAAQRGDAAPVAGGLQLAQNHLGVPNAIVEQRIHLRAIGIHETPPSRVTRRGAPPSQGPSDRLGRHAQFGRDAALVDTAFDECFNHQEVLRSQDLCPSGLARPRKDILAADRRTLFLLFGRLPSLALKPATAIDA
jgi:hypothetical protein